MNLYEPQQHLSFQNVAQLHDEASSTPFTKTLLKSSTSILVKENETVTKIYDKKDPYKIQFKVTKSESYRKKHIERHIVFINYSQESPQKKYAVTAEVFNIHGKHVDSVTSTISGDADIREKDDD